MLKFTIAGVKNIKHYGLIPYSRFMCLTDRAYT